ncbi:protein-tyrosine phosphatase family protein [Haloarchaeobius sp. DT45]|uniref:protein-tyrosine phosphatase family protein n=1 Tax=Haloarchaeobius sp. DT45 TaxID=3446116 RepID=UPI003F6B95D3
MSHGSNDSEAALSAFEHEDDTVLVRPKGYVEDYPVVCRIGDRDLYLGNELAADPQSHDRHCCDRDFAFVLSATAEERPLTTHHRPLVDGPGTDWTRFERAADTVRRLYRKDGSLLVHCRAGISRSSTLLAIALAAEDGRSFREALGLVQAVRPAAMPHPALHERAVVYLAEKGV